MFQMLKCLLLAYDAGSRLGEVMPAKQAAGGY